METVGGSFEFLTSSEAGKSGEKGKGGRRRNKTRGISALADYSSLFYLLGQALRGGIGGGGSCGKRRYGGLGEAGSFLFLSPSRWVRSGRNMDGPDGPIGPAIYTRSLLYF